MDYKFLISDLNLNKSQKIIGTDKGLAKIGDGIVNVAYSVAKSIFLTKNSPNDNNIRTGKKVGKVILEKALKNANMKSFAKTRANAHDLADTVESIIAYVWLSNKMTIKEIIEFLVDNLSGNLYDRNEEIEKLNLKDLYFQCNLRADKVNENLAEKLRNINCWLVHIGIESVNNRVLKGINKMITFEDTMQTLNILKKI